MDNLTYKGYTGSKVIDEESNGLHGRILFIDDLVTYEGERPLDLKAAFEAAVDDYIETCKSIGKEPQKPYTGLFNVRVSPELHKAAAVRAFAEGLSLNKVMVRALETYLAPMPAASTLSSALSKSADASLVRLRQRSYHLANEVENQVWQAVVSAGMEMPSPTFVAGVFDRQTVGAGLSAGEWIQPYRVEREAEHVTEH